MNARRRLARSGIRPGPTRISGIPSASRSPFHQHVHARQLGARRRNLCSSISSETTSRRGRALAVPALLPRLWDWGGSDPDTGGTRQPDGRWWALRRESLVCSGLSGALSQGSDQPSSTRFSRSGSCSACCSSSRLGCGWPSGLYGICSGIRSLGAEQTGGVAFFAHIEASSEGATRPAVDGRSLRKQGAALARLAAAATGSWAASAPGSWSGGSGRSGGDDAGYRLENVGSAAARAGSESRCSAVTIAASGHRCVRCPRDRVADAAHDPVAAAANIPGLRLLSEPTDHQRAGRVAALRRSLQCARRTRHRPVCSAPNDRIPEQIPYKPLANHEPSRETRAAGRTGTRAEKSGDDGDRSPGIEHQIGPSTPAIAPEAPTIASGWPGPPVWVRSRPNPRRGRRAGTASAYRVFDVVSEDIEEQEVAADVRPAAVHEHAGENGERLADGIPEIRVGTRPYPAASQAAPRVISASSSSQTPRSPRSRGSSPRGSVLRGWHRVSEPSGSGTVERPRWMRHGRATGDCPTDGSTRLGRRAPTRRVQRLARRRGRFERRSARMHDCATLDAAWGRCSLRYSRLAWPGSI